MRALFYVIFVNIQIEEELIQAHINEINNDDKTFNPNKTIFLYVTDEGQLVRDIITNCMKYVYQII